ncbi:MAG: hypothetical protein SH817_10285 [Leptospira sp.]|nr:hypothetical protein [Leptospira sp.]
MSLIPQYYVIAILTGGLYAMFGGSLLKEDIHTQWEVLEMNKERKMTYIVSCTKNYNMYDPIPIRDIENNREIWDYGDFCRDLILEKLIQKIYDNRNYLL